MLVLLHADCKSILAYCFKRSESSARNISITDIGYILFLCDNFLQKNYFKNIYNKSNVNIETTLLSFCILMTKCIKRNKTN